MRILASGSKKSNSIQDKILKRTITIVVVTLVFLGIMSVCLNYQSTFNALKQTMAETVELAASSVQSEIKAYQNILHTATLNPIITDNTVSPEEKQSYLETVASNYGFLTIDITDSKGISILTGEDLSSMEAFTVLADGTYYISNPFKSEDGASMYITLAVPIKSNDTFYGMLYANADASILSGLLANINIGETGNAAILDKNGNTIGFEDYQLVLDSYNTQEEAKTDKKLKKLAAIEKAMTEGKTDYGEYYYNGKNKFMSYTPIIGTDGWSIDVSVVRDEFLTGTKLALILTVIVVVLAIIISGLFMMRLSKNIVAPIRECADRLTLVANGDLTSDIPSINTGDETQILADTTEILVTRLKEMIQDLTGILGKMASKNFDVASNFDYLGDFVPLQTSIGAIIQNLNKMFGNIYDVTAQVNTGADEISTVSQNLSEGAMDQAGTIEELSASIADISAKVNQTAESSIKASQLSDEVTSKAEHSNVQMQRMSEAMKEISSTSEQIGQIIKTIDDIAAQTNLLSLNASIEAARAGDVGKGFAVVANEIRELAEKSATAVRDTTGLIEASLRAVENGSQTARDTAQALETIVAGIENTNGVIQGISQDAAAQSEAISQITVAIDQISEIIQSTSAIAEESAASSDSLNQESQELKRMLDEFTFKIK